MSVMTERFDGYRLTDRQSTLCAMLMNAFALLDIPIHVEKKYTQKKANISGMFYE